MKKEKKLVIYQAENGAIALKGDSSTETIWATQKQMAEIFNVTPQNITIHLKNIFSENELEENATCKESLQVQIEGKRKVQRKVKEYNLDVIIAVGYRISSVVGTHFRQWATQTLKQHITKGYTINSVRIEKHYEEFLHAVEEVKALAQNNNLLKSGDVLELVKSFATSWFSLESYDENKLPKKGMTQKQVEVESHELDTAVQQFKKELLKKKEATELFAQEKQEKALEGIFGNIFQSAFGEDVYPSVEEKAVHFLYFIVKNHPFTDGNKRTGAFSFLWFLQKSGISFREKITPEALTAITLLVAESNPKDKERVIGLLLLLLQK